MSEEPELQEERDLVECRKLLVEFSSSKSNMHSRLIVGFSVLLFTFVEVMLKLHDEIRPMTGWQFLIAYSVVFLLSFGLWYLFMRSLVYGIYTEKCKSTPPRQGDGLLLQRLEEAVTDKTKDEHILGIIPTGWFFSYTNRRVGSVIKGMSLCVALACITKFVIACLIDFELITFLLKFLSQRLPF